MQIFRATHFGAAVGIGVSGAVYLGISAIGKANTPSNPYVLANEIISAEIGRYLRLPIPPCCVVSSPTGADHFASLDFNLTGNSLPPIIPPNFYAAFRDYVGLIVMFDAYIANSDRHNGNLSADYVAQRFNIFDHSHVLFSGTQPSGIQRLQLARAALVIDASLGGNRHCLLDRLEDESQLLPAISKIAAIPDWFLDDIIEEASLYGLNSAEKSEVCSFLKTRRGMIGDIVSANKAAFRGIRDWSTL